MLRASTATLALMIANFVSGSALGESFDKPVRTRIVNLGQSRYVPNPASQVQLSCFYYPDFMVKELNDPGLKGIRWVTIAPTQSGRGPSCRLSHGPAERFLETQEWFAFEGVKGELVFLDAADGDENGGIPFRIVDWKTGKKIFEDSAADDRDPDFTRTPDGRLSIRYMRVAGGDCWISKEGASCWARMRKKYGIPPGPIPKCSPTDGASVIAYPVVVELSPKPSIKAVPGPVECWAVP